MKDVGKSNSGILAKLVTFRAVLELKGDFFEVLGFTTQIGLYIEL